MRFSRRCSRTELLEEAIVPYERSVERRVGNDPAAAGASGRMLRMPSSTSFTCGARARRRMVIRLYAGRRIPRRVLVPARAARFVAVAHDPTQVMVMPAMALRELVGRAARRSRRTLVTRQEDLLTFVLPQPEVDYVALFGDLYMMPRKDGILLGGTHERGNWNAEPDPEARERILEGHQKLFASMRG